MKLGQSARLLKEQFKAQTTCNNLRMPYAEVLKYTWIHTRMVRYGNADSFSTTPGLEEARSYIAGTGKIHTPEAAELIFRLYSDPEYRVASLREYEQLVLPRIDRARGFRGFWNSIRNNRAAGEELWNNLFNDKKKK
jgi:hypothetical protein